MSVTLHCAGVAYCVDADLRPDVQESTLRTKYDLIANICHDSLTEQTMNKKSTGEVDDPLSSGSYRVHVRNDSTGQVRGWLPNTHCLSDSPLLASMSSCACVCLLLLRLSTSGMRSKICEYTTRCRS